MFSCKRLTVKTPDGQTILKEASIGFKDGGMNALIGPSGCGKTTLVKAMLGILPREGSVSYNGQAVENASELAGQIGFAPQFSIAQPKLSVEETIRYTLELFVDDPELRKSRLESILQTIGLIDRRGTLVESLSGGQLRRLGLGLELTLDPQLLVCDEVTSGLDPNSEDQILSLLDSLRKEQGKTFVCIIHNLAKLDFFDCITVVNAGSIVFQGTLPELCAYFEIPDALHLYDILDSQSPEHWREKWQSVDQPAPAVAIDSAPAELSIASQSHPSSISQLSTLIRRRFRLFMRDKGYLGLTLAITLGFPCMVVIFALDGLPQVQGLAMERDIGIMEELKSNLAFQVEQMQTAQLVTGANHVSGHSAYPDGSQQRWA